MKLMYEDFLFVVFFSFKFQVSSFRFQVLLCLQYLFSFLSFRGTRNRTRLSTKIGSNFTEYLVRFLVPRNDKRNAI